MYIRRISSSTIASLILLLGIAPVKANEFLLGVVDDPNCTNCLGSGSNGIDMLIKKHNLTTGESTTLLEFTHPSEFGSSVGGTFIDEYEGKMYIGGPGGKYAIYDIEIEEVLLAKIIFFLQILSSF